MIKFLCFCTLLCSSPLFISGQEKKPVNSLQHSGGYIYFDGKNHYASLGVQFEILSTDSFSGLKHIFYITDLDTNFQKYRGPLSDFKKEGSHYIAYRFEDNVGNFSPIRHFEFILDTTPPQVYLDIDKNAPKIGNYVYISRKFRFILAASDTLSGVKSIEHSLNGSPFLPYQESFLVANDLKTGLHHFNFKATDNVGNVTKSHLFAFFLDETPPLVTYLISPSPFVKDTIHYISQKSLISIVAQDAESKTDKILYSLDESPFSLYQTPLTNLTPGKHILKAKAYDLLGNESEEVLLEILVDSTSPKAALQPEKRATPLIDEKPVPSKKTPSTPRAKENIKKPQTEKKPVWGIFGNVYDQETKAPVKGLEVWVTKLGNTPFITKTSNDGGDFKIELEKDSEYEIMLSKRGFFNYTTRFSTKNKEPGWYNLKKLMKTEIQKVKIGAIVEFEAIHFELNSFNIDKKGQETLDKIADFLAVNTNIVVDLRAHTDSRGSAAVNRRLSEKRARSAVHYLVQKGIAKERLFPQGYGETQIKNHCKDNVPCTEQEHLINRRVELKLRKILNSREMGQKANKKYVIEEY